MKTGTKDLLQRLLDLDCDKKQAEQIAALVLEGNIETAYLLLRRHRKQLMDDLHKSEKRVDDLDFLVYKIDKNKLELQV